MRIRYPRENCRDKFIQYQGKKNGKFIVEGGKACVIAAYDLRSPKGNTSTKDVVEVLSVKGDKIVSSSIYFDTEDFKAFMTQ